MRIGWAARPPEAPTEAHDSDGSAASAHPFELAAADLTTTRGRFTGWIATDGQRTSDWLNHNGELVVRGMSAVGPTDDLADPSLAVASGLTEHRLQAHELLFLIPPPLPANRHLRLHRRKVRVHLEMGDYRVVGQLHVRPGASAGDYVLRSSRSMVPLTEVELVHVGEPEFRRTLAVLIINARHVTRMQDADQRRRQGSAVPARPPSPALTGLRPPSSSRPAPVARPQPAADALSALRLLLDAGLLDITEFQTKRAQLLAEPGS